MKKVVAVVKLQLPAGKATPAPPVGPALGQHGANIMEFVKAFNAATANMGDAIVVLEIAKQKMPDLNTTDLEAAARMIAGSARSMGVEVVGAPEVKDA